MTTSSRRGNQVLRDTEGRLHALGPATLCALGILSQRQRQVKAFSGGSALQQPLSLPQSILAAYLSLVFDFDFAL